MFKSLRMKMILLFSVVIMFCGITISINIFKKSEGIILSSVGEQAKSITERATLLLSNAEYASVYHSMEENENYYQLREELNKLRETNGLKYLYTMRADNLNGELVYSYVIDGMPLETTAEDVSNLGDVVEEPDNGTINSFNNHTVEIGELDYSELYGATITTIMPIYNGDEFLGVVGADFNADQIYEELKTLKQTIILLLIVVLLISIAVTIIISSLIVKPIRSIVKDLNRIGQGDLTVQVKIKREDEIGQLGVMFNSMVVELRHMIETIKTNLGVMNKFVNVLSNNMSSSNELSLKVNHHLEKADLQTEQQHIVITETSRSLDEVGAGITRVATTAEEMLVVANSASRLADEGNQYMEKLSLQMTNIIDAAKQVETDVEQLTDHSQHINEILDVMKNITSQTGLLALNASIEAARAGEHGKGFNVVAEQIRKLAEQSKQSAEQVTNLIEGVIETTNRVREATLLTGREIASGADSVQHASTAFQAINKEVSNVANQANELSATSEEIEATTLVVSQLASDVTVIADESLNASKTVKVSVLDQIDSVTRAYEVLENLTLQSNQLADYIKRFKIENEANENENKD